MIILRSAHDLIVDGLRQQIDDLRAERDWFRSEWVKSLGSSFSAKPESNEQASLSPARSVPDQSTSPIDADWSEMDRGLFADWSREQTPRLSGTGIQPEDEWRRRYGDRTPLEALTV